MVKKKNHHKVGCVDTVSSQDNKIFLSVEHSEMLSFGEPISSMLGAKLAYDPKIKVVPHIKYYNFALVNTSMHGLYHIVQTRSNIL